MRVRALFSWMLARHSIYEQKAKGYAKPWTGDPILQQWRFCNVYRELDKETVAIKNLWRDPYRDEPDLWFAMVVARLVNWSPTLRELGYPASRWNPEKFVKTIQGIQQRGGKAWGGAYIVSTNGESGDKAEYIAHKVLTPLWKDRKDLRPQPHDTLGTFFHRLLPYNGMGTFIAAQVVADLKYVEPLSAAEDWWTFAASGPGSRRGLNRVFNAHPNTPWNTKRNWHAHLMELKKAIDPLIQKAGLLPIHAQDLQNCLCEFDKYERVRLGEGYPRARYPGV